MDWNVLGHEWAADLLGQHIARGEVRHAYLFAGAPGVGRRALALRFAQALNCLQPPAPGQPCFTCRTCTQTFSQQLPDLSVVQSLDDEGVPRPGGSLKIEQVRALQHNFQEATTAAQNSLLKPLEEAPEKAILLLTADSPENLLPTILSRCEVLRLRPLGVERLAQELEQRWGLKAAEARRLAHLSGGRAGYALRLHADPAEQERIQGWLEDLLRLLGATRRARFKFAEQYKGVKSRDALRSLLTIWISFWRDLLLACNAASAPLTNLDQQDDILRLASRLEPTAVRTHLSGLELALERLDANVNPQLLLEVL